MNDKDFFQLKEQLDKESYQHISFSENEKGRVMMRISEKEKHNKRKIGQTIVLTIATLFVVVGGGALAISEIQKSPEATVEKSVDVTEEAPVEDIQVNEDDTEMTSNASEDTLHDKAWADKTITEGLTENDPQNVQEFIAQFDEIYKEPLPEQYSDDPALYYQIGAMLIFTSLDMNYKAEGVAVEKDLQNLRDVAAIVREEHQARYAHLGLENENPHKYEDQFKEPSERLEQGHVYVKALLNDLNIALNDAEGTTEGYTYMLDGEKIAELEAFIRNE